MQTKGISCWNSPELYALPTGRPMLTAILAELTWRMWWRISAGRADHSVRNITAAWHKHKHISYTESLSNISHSYHCYNYYAPWFSSETLALYKSLAYLLTYLLTYYNFCLSHLMTVSFSFIRLSSTGLTLTNETWHNQSLWSANRSKSPFRAIRPTGRCWSRFLSPYQITLHDHRIYTRFLTVLTVPAQGGIARLSWPGWLVTYRDGLNMCRWSSIQVLTRHKS